MIPFLSSHRIPMMPSREMHAGPWLTKAIDHLAEWGIGRFLQGVFGMGIKLKGATMPDGSRR